MYNIEEIAKTILTVAKKANIEKYGILPNLNKMYGKKAANLKAWKASYQTFLTDLDKENIPEFLNEVENMILIVKFMELLKDYKKCC